MALADAPTALAQCDTAGCVIAADAATIAISLSPHGLGDDCRRADYVIALYRAVAGEAMGCPDGTPALDLFDLQRDGAHVLWIGDSVITIECGNRARRTTLVAITNVGPFASVSDSGGSGLSGDPALQLHPARIPAAENRDWPPVR
jgi:hypothetical protein